MSRVLNYVDLNQFTLLNINLVEVFKIKLNKNGLKKRFRQPR